MLKSAEKNHGRCEFKPGKRWNKLADGKNELIKKT